MGEPVVVVWLNKAKDSWYQLSDEERNAIFAKLTEVDKEVGGKQLVAANCEWSTPLYNYFGVFEYPSIEAVQKYFEVQRESGLPEHIESTYVIGTHWG